MGILTGATVTTPQALATSMRRVAADGGPGPWRQVLQILGLTLGGRGLGMKDYYAYDLWRASARGLRRDLVPERRRSRFNNALRMPGHGPGNAAIEDKLATEALLTAAGLPAVRTLAAYLPCGREPPAHVLPLRDRTALATWFKSDGPLPVFGKPTGASFSRGSAVLSGRDAATGALLLPGGRQVATAALLDEIAADWSTGYLFQPLHRPAAALRPHTASAMSSLRLTTLLTAEGPALWYAVLFLPRPGAIQDRSSHLWALVDPASGRIARLRDIHHPGRPDLTPADGGPASLIGLTLPYWREAKAAALAAHALFPGHGILGWDLFLTDDGALLNEVNGNPGVPYQQVALDGLQGPAMAPLYARALAHARAVNGTDRGAGAKGESRWAT